MSEQTPASTPSQTQPSTTTGSTSSGRGNSNGGRSGRGGRGYSGRGRGGNYRQRRATNIQAIIDADRDYQGSVQGLGVIGLPSERNLRHGLQLDDFNDAILAHAGENYTKGEMLKVLIMNLEDPEKEIMLNADPVPDKDTNPGEFERWKIREQTVSRDINTLKDNKKKLYNLVYNQCTNAMQAEIRADRKWKRKDRVSDALWLLTTIRKISSGILSRKNEVMTVVNQTRELLTMTQKPTETVDAFAKRLNIKMQTVDLAGGSGLFLPDLKNITISEDDDDTSTEDEISSDEYDTPDEGENEKAKEYRLKKKADKATRRAEMAKAKLKRQNERMANKEKRRAAKIKKTKKELVQSMILLQQSDRMRFGTRYDEMDAATDLGRDEFPKTYHAAVDMLASTDQRLIDQHNRSSVRSTGGRGTNGATFAQATGRNSGGRGNGNSERNIPRTNEGYRCIPEGETIVPGRDGTVCNYQCWTCNAWGHTNQNGNCPNEGQG